MPHAISELNSFETFPFSKKQQSLICFATCITNSKADERLLAFQKRKSFERIEL